MESKLDRMAKKAGCTIRKCGNVLQLRKGDIGCVFQSHSKEDIKAFLYNHQGEFMTLGIKDYYVSERAVKYGRIVYG